ncbi:MAG: mechanosensitive ion channel family protein [Myxococcota bacterium]
MNFDFNSALDYAKHMTMEFGFNVVAALIIFIIGKFVIKYLNKFISSVLDKTNLDKTVREFFGHLASILLNIFLVLAVLSKLGIEITSFVVILGALSLAVGLATQGALANFAAGILIMVFKPFRANDFVEIAGERGFIDKISILMTNLHTIDNKKVVIANKKVMEEIIINYSANEKRRVDLVVGISYSDDIDKARKLMLEAVSEQESLLKDPDPAVAVASLGDSSVNMLVKVWVKNPDYIPAKAELTERIKKKFDQGGISIPFPQQDCHIFKEE